MLFENAVECEPCGLFTEGHFKLIIITIIGIIIALKKTINKTKEEVKSIIKVCTIVLSVLEAVIISFKLITGDIRNVGNYVPLYYCSLLLYSGLLSSFSKGKLQRMGDVFLVTGGIIGGIIFIIFPTTSFTIIASVGQMTLPFYIIYVIIKIFKQNYSLKEGNNKLNIIKRH